MHFKARPVGRAFSVLRNRQQKEKRTMKKPSAVARERGTTSTTRKEADTHMNTKERLERIWAAVTAKYATVADVCVRNGLKRWREERCEDVEEPLGDLAHTITSPEMEELAIQWHVADIEENIAIERAKLAELRAREARARFISALAETEGYCPDDDDNVVISRLEVWRVDKEKLKRELPRKVVAFSRAVANGDVPLADLLKCKVPSAFKEIRLIVEYAKDLADFLTRTGEEGHSLIKRICDDMDYAANLAKNGAPDGMPDSDAAPLRFLAQQVVDTRTPLAALNEKRRPVGFSAA